MNRNLLNLYIVLFYLLIYIHSSSTITITAYNSVKSENAKVIYLTPQGKKLDQNVVNRLSNEKHLILLCGHYEGIDQRVIDKVVDEEISIGDYVLTGGEIPAMVLIDSVSRYIEGVLNQDSIKEESFSNGLLEYPQYTRPEVFEGEKVRFEVLLFSECSSLLSFIMFYCGYGVQIGVNGVME